MFEDMITKAEGRKQYEAQWYGLKTVFSDIQRLEYQVTSSGNPIELSLKNSYTVKGINKEQTIDSRVLIYYDETTNKITKVQDRWNDKLPEGAFKDAMRKLNAVTVPVMVSVPKTKEEEAAKSK